MRIQDGDDILFDFGADADFIADPSTIRSENASERPLRLHLGTTYEEAGVGYQVWDSAIAMAILQRSNLLPSLPDSARVIELGAGLALPGLDLARRGYAVTVTDARVPLLELAARNAEATRRDQQDSGRAWADVSTAQLQWGNGFNDVEPHFDFAMGSDICYEESSVPALAQLIDTMRIATCVIGPATRPSMRALLRHLAENTHLDVTERKLTLVCNNAEKEQLAHTARRDGTHDEMRSGGVHSLIMIRPAETH